MRYWYNWLLGFLVLFDTALTLLSVYCWGAAEANPIMGWVLSQSVWLFIAVKVVPIGLLIYLANTSHKQHYVKLAFWAYLSLYLFGLVAVNHQGLRAEEPVKKKASVVTKAPVEQPKEVIKPAVVEQPKKAPAPVVESGWNTAVVTTYANKFEGRTMANGKVFHHSDRVIACRCGSLGDRVEIRYGKNGRSTCILSDRGGLPLHRHGRWQFDVSKAVARDLGLYRIVNGKTDRVVRWRYVKEQQ